MLCLLDSCCRGSIRRYTWPLLSVACYPGMMRPVPCLPRMLGLHTRNSAVAHKHASCVSRRRLNTIVLAMQGLGLLQRRQLLRLPAMAEPLQLVWFHYQCDI